jgi:hypothetical protein
LRTTGREREPLPNLAWGAVGQSWGSANYHCLLSTATRSPSCTARVGTLGRWDAGTLGRRGCPSWRGRCLFSAFASVAATVGIARRWGAAIKWARPPQIRTGRAWLQCFFSRATVSTLECLLPKKKSDEAPRLQTPQMQAWPATRHHAGGRFTAGNNMCEWHHGPVAGFPRHAPDMHHAQVAQWKCSGDAGLTPNAIAHHPVRQWQRADADGHPLIRCRTPRAAEGGSSHHAKLRPSFACESAQATYPGPLCVLPGSLVSPRPSWRSLLAHAAPCCSLLLPHHHGCRHGRQPAWAGPDDTVRVPKKGRRHAAIRDAPSPDHLSSPDPPP